MNRNEIRRVQMEETRQGISKELIVFQKLLLPYRLFYTADLENYTFDLLRRRLSRLPVRAYFIRKNYEYVKHYLAAESVKANHLCNDLHRLFMIKLAFVFEVVIVIQYLHNQILDKKFGVDSHQGINRNLIASNILREILFKYIDKEIEVLARDHKLVTLIRNTVREVLLVVDLGQRIDKEYSHYEAYLEDKEIPFDEKSEVYQSSDVKCIKEIKEHIRHSLNTRKNFVEIYFRRIFLTNNSLFRFITNLVLKIMGYTGKEQQNLINFSLCYATVLQIVNDNADFAILDDFEEKQKQHKNIVYGTSAKKEGDMLSDLKNFNITLPLIFHLDAGFNRLIEKYLRSKDDSFITKYQQEMIKEIILSGGLRKSMRVGRNIAQKGLTYLDTENPEAKFFESMLEIAKINKYYYVLYGFRRFL